MNDVKLTDTQARAVKSIKHWYKHETHVQPWFYLAGFAGVGKTTVLKYVLAELGLTAEGMTPDVVAACYTAKASLVLTRAGVPATTIHRLIYNVKHVTDKQIHDKEGEIQKLEFQAMTGDEPGLAAKIDKAKRELTKMLELQVSLNEQSRAQEAKLIVIDEVSMCGQKEAFDLLSFGKPILVIGDPGQLPPIRGEGYFATRKPDFMLSEIHRQAQESPIIRLSMLARQGQAIPQGQHGETVFKWPRSIVADNPDLLLAVDQVICGKNATRLDLNNKIRHAKGIKGALPTPDDKIIVLKNDYERGLINGLFVKMDGVTKLDDRRFVAKITSDEADLIDRPNDPACYSGHYADHVAYDAERHEKDWKVKRNFKLVETTFGYAITVHKAQGSGFGSVLFWDDGLNCGDRKKLLYTAITRAIDTLLIVA
jgi:ATP-dependent exoDNAse (exonuclease V) alpha subunit